MGDKASSTDARGLRAQLESLNSAEHFENDMYILSDIKPKNVLCIDGEMYVIDAEITTK